MYLFINSKQFPGSAIFQKKPDVLEDSFFYPDADLRNNIKLHVSYLGEPDRIIHLYIKYSVIDPHRFCMIGKPISGYLFPEMEYLISIDVLGRQVAVFKNLFENTLQ